MSKNKWVRSISFNKTNEKDVARLRLIGKKSFSRFVKKLLDDELRRQNESETIPSVKETPKMQKKIIPATRPSDKQTPKPTIVKPKPLNPMLRRD